MVKWEHQQKKYFKLLCMHSKTEKSSEVREYFYGLEELIEELNDKIKT